MVEDETIEEETTEEKGEAVQAEEGVSVVVTNVVVDVMMNDKR